ncbi:mechanosensitive ion channel family protein [Skeletonema marinoi]|uniref:Mechanosensitive ion channel family protein n=1 Tax=Skeletonema marinoi TaxID=267567 RepID=A0AAD8Y1B0_9STRA|nr:mechanosensitive ion channel family protein [Skeletonema marinoi]
MSNAMSGSSGLPDLLSIMEAKRDQENEYANQGEGNSRGSRGSRGSVQGGSKAGSRGSRNAGGGSRSGGSRNGGSLFSGGASGARSRGESSGARRGRPFFGVTSPWSTNGDLSNVDSLLQAAERVQELCQIPEDEEDENALGSEDVSEQNAAFLSQLAASHPAIEPIDGDGLDGATNEQTPMLKQARMRRRVQIGGPESSNWLYNQPAFLKLVSWVDNLRKQMHLLAVAFDLPYVAESVWLFIQNEVTMYLVPALAVSAFLFYHLGNPSPKILENGATLSWWIIFGLRNYMTLQLAYGSEYVIVDVLALRSTVLLGLLGPLPTLYIIQAKGWPLVSIFWGLWSLALIQNMDGWLAWTDIEMFTAENHDGGILSGDTYLEVLASLIVIGVATTIKRTVLALYLGKRIYFHYKKKVERVMLEMLLITEVSDLSQAIDDFEFIEEEEKAARKPSTKGSIAQTFKNTTMADIAKKQLKRSSTVAENDSEEEDKNDEELNLSLSTDDSEDSDEEKSSQLLPNNPTWNTLRRDTSTQSDTSDVSAPDFHFNPLIRSNKTQKFPRVRPSTSTTSQIKSLLYRWDEPVNKQDKEIEDPTIHEILQFRKALSFLEDSHPFGLSFGPAFSRDSCIKSSKALYKRLLALTPGSTVLHFDVIGVLAYNADDSFDERKAKDAYKKLRYLRAGTGNSTLIDEVLENFFNGAFSFCLALAVMTILKMNPWALLVSLSTILVSFAFAFGPSVAQIIEGCIMIAVRRPFDLGDRIAIADASDKPQDCDPGYGATWLVEDCNLFTTTLRLAKSNEIATVKNGTIADKKIINHNRSDRALVNIVLSLKSTVTHEEATIVKSAIEQYISDNPRIWAQLINFRIIDVDPCNDVTNIAIRVQHLRSWQDLNPVMTARGDLIKFCTEVLIQLNVHYENKPAVINDVYVKELPEEYIAGLSQPVL